MGEKGVTAQVQLERSCLLNWLGFSAGCAVSGAGALKRYSSGENRLAGRKSWL